MGPPDSPTSPLLQLPWELRQQILTEALVSDIAEGFKYPTAPVCMPFDRHLLCFLSATQTWRYQATALEYGRPAFFGREPMTRLMRVNKQLYAETFQILWSDFAIYRPESYDSLPLRDWMLWMRKYNPRAIQHIRHLQIDLGCTYHSVGFVGEAITHDAVNQVAFFPNLRSVRFEVQDMALFFKEPALINQCLELVSEVCRKRGISCFAFCKNLPPNTPIYSIVSAFQRKIGQNISTPALHQEFLDIWPRTRFELEKVWGMSDAAKQAMDEGLHLLTDYKWKIDEPMKRSIGKEQFLHTDGTDFEDFQV